MPSTAGPREPGENTILERLEALERAMAEACAAEVRETELGAAHFTLDTPGGYDSNALIARPEGLTASALAEHLDDLYGGFAHRKAWVYDEVVGGAIAPGMRVLGYQAERAVVLALQGSPPRPHGPAREVTPDELDRMERAYMAEEGLTEDLVDQLILMRRRTLAGMRGRLVGAEGRSGARLYLHGDLASITDVVTLRAARGRGLARSVITLASHLALEEGARDVVLVTDAEDWMQGFYRRLGFGREAGSFWSFTATDR